MVKIIECPRDAMQGWKKMIPAKEKIRYLQSLLAVGFNTLDFGSFVNPKAIPQMADTAEVLRGLDLTGTQTELLAIIANIRGAEEASVFDEIRYLGFPFSISETFQQRNTHSSIEESFERVEEIQNICVKTGKELVIYLSMGFGNPYGDPYSEQLLFDWAKKIADLDIRIISLADTVGLATPEQVFSACQFLVPALPGVEVGVHLHARPGHWEEKISAALRAGCNRYDGALKGIGGCPMADDELVGNMDTVNLLRYFMKKEILPQIDEEALVESLSIAGEIFVE
jgi:hydroxymethylglutaryl-CoA lyase